MAMKSEHTVKDAAIQPGNKNVADLILELILRLFNAVSSKPFVTFMATVIPVPKFSFLCRLFCSSHERVCFAPLGNVMVP